MHIAKIFKVSLFTFYYHFSIECHYKFFIYAKYRCSVLYNSFLNAFIAVAIKCLCKKILAFLEFKNANCAKLDHLNNNSYIIISLPYISDRPLNFYDEIKYYFAVSTK